MCWVFRIILYEITQIIKRIIFRKWCFERISIKELKMYLKKKKEKKNDDTKTKFMKKLSWIICKHILNFKSCPFILVSTKLLFLPFDFSLKKRITVFESYFLKCPCSYQLRGNLCTTHCLHSDICTPSFRFKTYLTIHVWQT